MVFVSLETNVKISISLMCVKTLDVLDLIVTKGTLLPATTMKGMEGVNLVTIVLTDTRKQKNKSSRMILKC